MTLKVRLGKAQDVSVATRARAHTHTDAHVPMCSNERAGSVTRRRLMQPLKAPSSMLPMFSPITTEIISCRPARWRSKGANRGDVVRVSKENATCVWGLKKRENQTGNVRSEEKRRLACYISLLLAVSLVKGTEAQHGFCLRTVVTRVDLQGTSKERSTSSDVKLFFFPSHRIHFISLRICTRCDPMWHCRAHVHGGHRSAARCPSAIASHRIAQSRAPPYAP